MFCPSFFILGVDNFKFFLFFRNVSEKETESGVLEIEPSMCVPEDDIAEEIELQEEEEEIDDVEDESFLINHNTKDNVLSLGKIIDC